MKRIAVPRVLEALRAIDATLARAPDSDPIRAARAILRSLMALLEEPDGRRLGGQATSAGMTPEERSERARRSAIARWGTRGNRPPRG